ncbi:hypothetical protein SAY86_003163 [Trapa natans]|uniref:Uncharacterized protein n=1 Tax=Trapa natans TaxID=22666 RepID=A0AAN7LKD1_TRANT|nr:hypothetical protein SAY86_003163 [Trapa natans]
MEGPSRRLVPLLPSGGRGGSVRRMRRPLADCTNTACSSSQSSSSPSTSLLKPQAKPDFSISQSKSQFYHGKKVTSRSSISSHVAPASDQPPMPLPKSSYASGANQFETLGPFPVEGQGRVAGKAKTKAKAVTVPASSSPARRTRVSRRLKIYVAASGLTTRTVPTTRVLMWVTMEGKAWPGQSQRSSARDYRPGGCCPRLVFQGNMIVHLSTSAQRNSFTDSQT